MSENRKLISPLEQKEAIDIMLRFRDIHEEIQLLESQMESIKAKKEELLSDLELTRADDNFFQSKLEHAYGPGKLDATKLEWVIKTEKDENVNEGAGIS